MEAEVRDNKSSTPKRSIRWLLYLLVFLASGTQLYRIRNVLSKDGKTPFLSANDRSRWCTMEALVKNGDYTIDHLVYADESRKRGTPWHTIDRVMHRGKDGKQHDYSSKPTLLPTMYAGVYWSVKKLAGLDLQEDIFKAGRTIIAIVNWLPVTVFWLFLIHWFLNQKRPSDASEGDGASFANSNWSLVVLTIFLGWGTFLATFTNTLNNHLPAAMAVGVSLWCLERIAVRQDHRLRWFVLCGLATSFGAANELPALGWVAAAGMVLMLCDWKRTLLAYTPALIPVALGFFGTNYLAHDTWKPAYAHRDKGALLCEISLPETQEDFLSRLRDEGIELSDRFTVRKSRREGTDLWFDLETERKYAIEYQNDRVQLYEWGDWYDYEGSYWNGKQQGVDKGEPSRMKYAFHCLIGHHGVFSLTPFWLLLPFGMIGILNRGWNPFVNRNLLLAGAVTLTSIVVIGFYLARGIEDRNYGGVTSGLRWTFWLIPFWAWIAVFALRNVRTGWARRCVEFLVLASIFSASYPWNNPWTTPWLMEYWPLGAP